MTQFVSKTVLKSDVFSQTQSGYMADQPEARVIRRIVTASPWWSRPMAWFLAKKEIKALRAVQGIDGVPTLLSTDEHGLYRTWTDGAPLHLARPDHIGWYREAHALLRAMRARGVTHNDLAKPQNWLMTPEGHAAVIDFQLASTHRRRSWLARTMAYEDLRHLLKQKRSFAPHLLTPVEKRVLARKSLPSRIWMATGKRVYNFVTRSVFNWSDGEGTGDRLLLEGPAIETALKDQPGVTDWSLHTYSLPSKGVGLYVFVEGDASEPVIKQALPLQSVDYIQTVDALPRSDDGAVRTDLLQFVAMNQISELEAIYTEEPKAEALVEPIVEGRKNLTDRRLTHTEI